jgi:hypothetical protein
VRFSGRRFICIFRSLPSNGRLFCFINAGNSYDKCINARSAKPSPQNLLQIFFAMNSSVRAHKMKKPLGDAEWLFRFSGLHFCRERLSPVARCFGLVRCSAFTRVQACFLRRRVLVFGWIFAFFRLRLL